MHCCILINKFLMQSWRRITSNIPSSFLLCAHIINFVGENLFSFYFFVYLVSILLLVLIFLKCMMVVNYWVFYKYFSREKYGQRTAAGVTINFAAIFLLIFCLTITSLVHDPRFRRRPRPEGEMLLSDSGSQ